jgi:hypothetical protein
MLGARPLPGYGPDMIERARGGLALICLVTAACAGTAPPAKTPAAAATGPGAVVKAPTQPTVGPPVTLMPAATARPFLLAAVSIGSIDRLLENGVRLVGTAVPLQMTAKEVREKLLGEMGLGPEVAENLDLASPTGAAVVALDEKGRTGVVLAIPARGPAGADKLIEALGKPVMTSGPLTMIANAAGKSQGWVYRAGSVVVLGDEVDGMARGAMLALEARRAGAEDVTTTLYPAAIAAAHGTDVKTAIAHALEEMQKAQQAMNPASLMDKSMYDVVGKMLGLVGDTDRVEIGLSVDAARGLTFRTRLMPRPGTALEAVARDVHPFQIDPVVFAGMVGSPMLVGATSMGPFWRDIMAGYRAHVAASKEKGAAAALVYYDAYLAAMGDMQSAAASVGKDAPYVTIALSQTLKNSASAGKLAAALARMDNAATAAFLRAEISWSSMLDIKAKRETVGKLKAAHFILSPKKGSTLDTETVRRVFPKGFDVYQAVSGTRWLATLGRDARARLLALAAGKGTPPKSAALADAEGSAKGRDSFDYFDLAPILGLLGTIEADAKWAPALRGNLGPIPLIWTAGGDGAGKAWTADLTVPPTAFSSIGSLVGAIAAAGLMTAR